jgi:hypothetical protein
MNWLWPQKTKPDVGIIGRLGRTLHWLGLALCAAPISILANSAWRAAFAAGPYDTWSDVANQVPMVIGLVIGIYAIARALRYILSSE